MALFGTDGVRGVANVDLTAELAVDLAIAAAHVFGEIGALPRTPSVPKRAILDFLATKKLTLAVLRTLTCLL